MSDAPPTGPRAGHSDEGPAKHRSQALAPVRFAPRRPWDLPVSLVALVVVGFGFWAWLDPLDTTAPLRPFVALSGFFLAAMTLDIWGRRKRFVELTDEGLRVGWNIHHERVPWTAIQRVAVREGCVDVWFGDGVRWVRLLPSERGAARQLARLVRRWRKAYGRSER